MRNLAAIGLIVLAGALPANLEAQATSPNDRIQAAMERVGQAGIPASLLEMKIREGQAKGVPAARIAMAVERRADGLLRAREAFARADVRPTRDDLSAGADAVGAGVSEAALTVIASEAPEDRRLVAIAVLGELVTQGHVPQEALDRVRDALARGPEALANLPAQAAEARTRRGPPNQTGPGQAGPPAGVPAPGRGEEGRGRPGAQPPAGGPPIGGPPGI